MESVNNTKFLFSIINGFNFYKIEKEADTFVEAKHYNNSIDVNIVYCNSVTNKEIWKNYIENPPGQKFLIWPIDVVNIKKNNSLKNDSNIGLVFRQEAFPKLETLKSLVYDPSKLGLENEAVKKILINLLLNLMHLEDAGYIYNSFDLEKIYYDPHTFDVYIKFALSTTKKIDDTSINNIMLHNDISIDFLPPWNKNGASEEKVNPDQHKFSIAALLFKMIIGRMPYQGRMFDGYGDIFDYKRDTDKMLHRKAMELYLELNTFIFDNNDDSNKIGTFTNETKQVLRWDSLNEKLKNMFYNTFVIPSGAKENKHLYSLQDWYQAINCN